MSNARNRARQLERAALAPKRITNRAVVPDGALMLAQHADRNGCRSCGYAVCSCVTHVPMRAYEWTIASPTNLETFTCRGPKPAPQPAPGAFVVPNGWCQPYGNGTWAVDADMPRPYVELQGGLYGAWRGDGDRVASFANLYAAMLCALGFDVREMLGPYGRRWDIARPGLMHSGVQDHELPALVERLTAERANERAADAARARAAAIVTRDRAGLEQHARIDAEREP